MIAFVVDQKGVLVTHKVWQHGKTLLIWIGRRNGTWWHLEPGSREQGFLRRLKSQGRRFNFTFEWTKALVDTEKFKCAKLTL